MYHQFFGLAKDPFSLTPDPAFLFLTAAHREALAGVTYSILSRKGFVVLMGDAGTGKTTLLTRIFQSIPSSRVRFSVVLNPTLTPAEFLELALLDFGITDIPSSKAQRLNLLQKFLVEAYRHGQVAVLVVDEAHKLSPEVLEEIRLLSNFELAEAKLLQIVLAGQTELGDVLNRPDLRQLKQRIAVRLSIQPLSRTGVEHYLQHRWQKAGAAKPHPFESEAVDRIAEFSRGIPRLVNVLCDNALALAYAEGITTIGIPQIVEVAGDLDMIETRRPPVRAAGAATPATSAQLQRNRMASAAMKGYPQPEVNPAPARNGAVPADRNSILMKYQDKAAKTSPLLRLAGKLGLLPKPLRDV